MEKADVVYKRKTASARDVSMHLQECNDNFRPLLTERANIEKYSQKIIEKAVTFEAWGEQSLVGLLAAYFSGDPDRYAFITNVSVLENFMGLGIATRLLNECIKYAVTEHFRGIKLEVHRGNNRAIALYRKFGFTFDSAGDDILKMKMELTSQPK